MASEKRKIDDVLKQQWVSGNDISSRLNSPLLNGGISSATQLYNAMIGLQSPNCFIEKNNEADDTPEPTNHADLLNNAILGIHFQDGNQKTWMQKEPSRKKRKFKPQSNTLLKYYPVAETSQSDSSDLDNGRTRDEKSDSLQMKSSSCTTVEENSFSTQDVIVKKTKENSCSSLNDLTDNVACLDANSGAETMQRDYGLLGLQDGEDLFFTDDDGSINEEHFSSADFSRLPAPVFETILCQLPLSDLLLNLSYVCQSWNEIISASNFIPWKKKYHKLKANVPDVVTEISRVASSAGMSFLHTYTKRLIEHMLNFNLTPVNGALLSLQLHKKFKMAELLITTKISKCGGTVSNTSLWAVVAALVVLSETMWDVYDIIRHLVKGPCPIIDAMEALYCIASFLLHLKRRFRVGYGLHYRIYYALYMYENNWTATVSDLSVLRANIPGQQTLLKYGCGESKLKLTHEQMRIVNHRLHPNQIVKVIAFAGSGKTSTLVEFTKMRPNLKFLAVMYNKGVAQHAKSCFPFNVECRTSHSLAWKSQGSRFRAKLTQKIRPYDIQQFLISAPTNYGRKQQHARCVITTVENFMSSADEFITMAHAPTQVRGHEEIGSRILSDGERWAITSDAEVIWKKMTDPRDFDVRAVHDCYLKLYQLERPSLIGYDCILIDEAQDCNPAALDILLSQPCAKIVVGDPNQQIYAFRGAVDALEKVKGTHVYYLTQSFRFGPEIAHVANVVLEVLKGKDCKTLVGGAQHGSVMGSHTGQVSILARSNVALFNEAVRMMFNGPQRSYDPNKVFGAFAGGVRGYGLDQLVDIYNLMQGKKDCIRDHFISRFSNLGALQQYATHVDDVELLGKIRLVKQHADRIPEYVETIKSRCQTDMSMANVVFSTVHKAKGLEFDTVCILDDFSIGPFPYSYELHSQLQDEFNVLYVALTRAKKRLCMAPSIYFVLLGAHEKFEYPMTYVEEDLNPTCCMCHTTFTPLNSNLLMFRHGLELVGRSPISQGYLCPKCSSSLEFVPEVLHPLPFANPTLSDRHHHMFSWMMFKDV